MKLPDHAKANFKPLQCPHNTKGATDVLVTISWGTLDCSIEDWNCVRTKYFFHDEEKQQWDNFHCPASLWSVCVCVVILSAAEAAVTDTMTWRYGATTRDCLMSRACFQFVTSCITIFWQIIWFERLQLANNPCKVREPVVDGSSLLWKWLLARKRYTSPHHA